MTKKRIIKENTQSNKQLQSIKNPKLNTGRWSIDEHYKFINGVIEHGNNWEDVQLLIKSRNIKQLLSHSQKSFLKLKNTEFFGKENLYTPKNLKKQMQLKSEKEREILKCQLMKFNYGDIFDIEKKIHGYDFEKGIVRNKFFSNYFNCNQDFNENKNNKSNNSNNNPVSNFENKALQQNCMHPNRNSNLMDCEKLEKSNFNFFESKNIFEAENNAEKLYENHQTHFSIKRSNSKSEPATSESLIENLEVNKIKNFETNKEIEIQSSSSCCKNNNKEIFDFKIKNLSIGELEILREIEAQFCDGFMNKVKNSSLNACGGNNSLLN